MRGFLCISVAAVALTACGGEESWTEEELAAMESDLAAVSTLAPLPTAAATATGTVTFPDTSAAPAPAPVGVAPTDSPPDPIPATSVAGQKCAGIQDPLARLRCALAK